MQEIRTAAEASRVIFIQTVTFTLIKSNPTRSNVLAMLIALSAVSAFLLLFAPGRSAAAEATAGDTVTIPLGGKGKGLRVKGARVTALKPAKDSRRVSRDSSFGCNGPAAQ